MTGPSEKYADQPERKAEKIVARCRELGFALAGVVPLAPTSRADELEEWLRAGMHGTMDYLARNTEIRKNPAKLLEGARSIIVVADQYASRNDPGPDRAPAGLGTIARYARGRDYHKVMKKRLHALSDELSLTHAGEAFRACVDTAPILEREQAERAGLGWTGKHTLLIHPRRGSYLFLGAVLTTLELAPPRVQRRVPDRCGSCTRCIDACPTDAITPYRVNASRCISYLTIERRAPIPTALHDAMGGLVFGCDICQEVCPHNSQRRRAPTGTAHAAYEPVRSGFDLLEVLGWDEEDRRAAFERTALKRATLGMFKRNAIIALRNTMRTNADARSRVEAMLDDEDELVRTTARDVLARWDEGTG